MNSVAQTFKQDDRARLEWMLQRVQDHVTRLHEEHKQLSPESLEWIWVDNALFEARCELRRLKRALALAGRRWECVECGQVYGPEYLAAWGPRCDAECDGWLEEVTR